MAVARPRAKLRAMSAADLPMSALRALSGISLAVGKTNAASVTSAERAEFWSGTGLAVAKMSVAASPRSAAAEEYKNGAALLLVATGASPTVPLETAEM